MVDGVNAVRDRAKPRGGYVELDSATDGVKSSKRTLHVIVPQDFGALRRPALVFQRPALHPPPRTPPTCHPRLHTSQGQQQQHDADGPLLGPPVQLTLWAVGEAAHVPARNHCGQLLAEHVG